jgi:hypothetical protein
MTGKTKRDAHALAARELETLDRMGLFSNDLALMSAAIHRAFPR